MDLPIQTERKVLPISSGSTVQRGEVRRIAPMNWSYVPPTVYRTREAFQPERLYISDAGTARGAEDWEIRQILINGTPQLDEPKPGLRFTASRPLGLRCNVELPEIPADSLVELDVAYLGTNEDGAAFYASIVGTAVR